jgi:hypothetical protein
MGGPKIKRLKLIHTFSSFLTSNISLHKICSSLSSFYSGGTSAIAVSDHLLAALVAPLMILPPRTPNICVVVNVNIFFVFASWKCPLLYIE